ncbi:MAG: ABC transporter ATP-binding protein [Tetrasphaera sp.]
MPSIITTEKLSRTFSNQGVQQHVLKNLDLHLAAGEFTVIMGPSGAGKSTLLYQVSGMDRPTLGEITFAGTPLSGLSQDQLALFRREHCGFVFQQIHLLDSMSALDNILAVGLLRRRRDRRALVAKARDLAASVDLDPVLLEKFPSMLSGGENQRVALVRALVNDPDVLFADEPTGQLNSTSGQAVLDQLTRASQGGQTVVMVTHDLRSALRGERILYLRDGTIHGDLPLAAYDLAAGDTDDRLTRLRGFLTEMGW